MFNEELRDGVCEVFKNFQDRLQRWGDGRDAIKKRLQAECEYIKQAWKQSVEVTQEPLALVWGGVHTLQFTRLPTGFVDVHFSTVVGGEKEDRFLGREDPSAFYNNQQAMHAYLNKFYEAVLEVHNTITDRARPLAEKV